MQAVETMRSAAPCVACGAELQAERCDHCGVAARVRGYQVRRVLAEQPHSRVYLAAPPEGPSVVLKELTFSLVPDAQTLEAFHREAGLLRQLSHPQLPTFLEAFQEGTGVETRLYLAMTYVEGRSLQEELGAHPFSESEALDIAARALELLVYLHGLSPPVVHRDVKPANLLRRPDGTLSLVDFGAAREVQRATAGPATLVGTVGYMPPEQLVGVATPDGDIYALGATLVHLLTRTPPGELMGPDLRLEFKKRVRLGAPALEWLTKLVHRQPRRRFASAVQALEALRAVRSGSVARRRVLFAVGRGLGLAALAVGGLVMYRPQVERWVLAALDEPPMATPGATAKATPNVAPNVTPGAQAVRPPLVLRPVGTDVSLRLTCPAGATLAEDSKKRMSWCSHTSASGHEVRHGPLVRWDAQGGPIERSVYVDDVLHGPQVLYQDQTFSEGEWRQGKKTGPWVSYVTSTRKKEHEATYKDGVLDGPWRHFSLGGVLEEEGAYKDGQKHGVWSHYRGGGGGKESEDTFVDGKRSGPYISWHPYSTVVHKKGDYVDGHQTGLWSTYFRNGQLDSEGRYELGRQDGPWSSWHENGVLEEQGAYARGLQTGTWVTWSATGKKTREGSYDHGQRVGTWLEWYDSGGKRSVVSLHPGGLKRTTTWFQNGRMESQGAERGFRRHGLRTQWYPNGKKESVDFYEDGKHQGLSTRWHSNGRKASEGRYVDDRQTGTWRRWDSSGKPQSQERFDP